MPVSNFKRIDLDLLFPDFRDRLFDVVAACEARGYSYIAILGYRTYGEQMKLWTQGRTVPGQRVTNARGGQSAHNFGLAVDFVRDLDPKRAGVQPGWSTMDFSCLIGEVERAGLHSGHKYKDSPHVAHPGYVTASDMEPLDVAWQNAAAVSGDTLKKLQRVWQSVVALPISGKG